MIKEFSADCSTDDLGKYLGVSLIHSRVNKSSYLYIIEKIRRRLDSWENKKVALAGRIILAHSVISAIPAYAMQTAYLPTSVCTEIVKLCRSFIWGNTERNRKIALINWDKVQKPK